MIIDQYHKVVSNLDEYVKAKDEMGAKGMYLSIVHTLSSREVGGVTEFALLLLVFNRESN